MWMNRDTGRTKEAEQRLGQVILVDDDSQVLNSLSLLLSSYDFTVRSYDSARKALSAFIEEPADIVVTDFQMAGMNGITLLEKIREIDGETPVILMTGHAELEMALAAVRMRALEVILKPFDPEMLVDVVRRGIAGKREQKVQSIIEMKIAANKPSMEDGGHREKMLIVPQRISWNGILTQAMCIDLGGEVLNALNQCDDTLAINLDGVELLDHSSLVLLCTVKRQANEKAKKLILEETENPVVAAMIHRFRSNNLHLCRTYCGHSCLFD